MSTTRPLPRAPQVGDVYASLGRPPTEVDYWVVVGFRSNGRLCLLGHNERGDVVMAAVQPPNPKREVIGITPVGFGPIQWRLAGHLPPENQS